MSLIELKRVSKYYYNKNNISRGFEKVNLELDSGEFVVLTGESGSGKSTLLNVISGLDSYEDGEMLINGKETSHYSETDYEIYRRKYIGNIFQNFNLVNSYTVFQNIELVLLLNGYKKKDVKKKVLDVINMVGLSKYKNTKASKLSGGQKQRVAIARALVKETPIIVADEPTGNLDVQSAKSVMKLLAEISKSRLVVIVTHNFEQVEEYATRKITMNDGRIIEDKILKDANKEDAIPIEYNNISFMNKIVLGLRNTFNIKIKFVLLVLIYFFLTALVFSSYSSIRKLDYDESNTGVNYYFKDLSPNRIVINKKDKSLFTDADFEKINKLSNIKSITKEDLFTDIEVYIYSDYYYFSGNLKNSNILKKVDIGRLPENDNEIVIQGSKEEYSLSHDTNKLQETTLTMSDYMSYIISKDLKVVGIVYDDRIEWGEVTIYANDGLLKEAKRLNTSKYSHIDLTLNNKIYKDNSYNIYYNIAPSSVVKKGEAVSSESYNTYCKNWNCLNDPIHLHVENSYSTVDLDLKISHVFSKYNFKKYTGLPKKDFDLYYNYIFISDEDYDELFPAIPYQSSIYVKDTKKVFDTEKDLKKLGYNTYTLKNMMYSVNGEFVGIIRIIRIIAFAFALVALFFISYFIIRIILKSRNIYYSIIRILGSTRKICKELLIIELFNDVNIAYLTFVGLILLVKNKVINISFLSELITYFNVLDYVLIYIILIIMSLLISIRYAKKLFSASALKTYREES